MNDIPPEQLFLETVECPDEFLCLTAFEIGQIYDELYGGDD